MRSNDAADLITMLLKDEGRFHLRNYSINDLAQSILKKATPQGGLLSKRVTG